MKLLLYCTKAKPYLYKTEETTYPAYPIGYHLNNTYELANLNGKIVAECDFEVEKIKVGEGGNKLITDSLTEHQLLMKSCLDFKDILKYTESIDEFGYAIHIKNLHIFDKPKELDDFTTRTPVEYDSIICDSCTNFGFDCKKCRYSYDYQQVIKAPQNMMKVCEWDIEDKVLISIKPEWLCKILNGEKTIEVRRKVLKGMVD